MFQQQKLTFYEIAPENHLGNDSCLKLGNFIIVGHPDWENVTNGGQMQIRCGEFVAKPEFVYKHLGANNLPQIKEGRKTVTLVWQELQDLLTKHWAKFCKDFQLLYRYLFNNVHLNSIYATDL